MIKSKVKENANEVLLRGIAGWLLVMGFGGVVAYLTIKSALDKYRAEMAVLNDPNIMEYRAKFYKP